MAKGLLRNRTKLFNLQSTFRFFIHTLSSRQLWICDRRKLTKIDFPKRSRYYDNWAAINKISSGMGSSTYGEEFWEFWKVVNFKSAFWKILDIDSCNRHTKALKSQFSDFQNKLWEPK